MASLDSAKNLPKKIVSKTAQKTKGLLRLSSSGMLSASDVSAARDYIRDYWPKLERLHPNDDESLLGLPHKYLVPSYDENASFDYDELYYWDSYFMVQGMLLPEQQELVCGILGNLISLFERFKIIPNASRTYLMGRSQPPLLTASFLTVTMRSSRVMSG
jgi:neutral trehalase